MASKHKRTNASKVILAKYTIACDRCGNLIHTGEKCRLILTQKEAHFSHLDCYKSQQKHNKKEY